MDAIAASSPHLAGPAGRAWVTPEVAEIGRWLPGYEVLSLLGCGGMGAVYLALQTALDRSVAIKVLPRESCADEVFAQRFVREARAMARLNHPNIVPVFESGRTEAGHLFFVMEFVDGVNLATALRDGPLAPERALEIAAQVCAALAYAHAQGIVHRDIKPANVLLDPQGRVRVADFGIARVTEPGEAYFSTTQTGVIIGTPDYMAPEQMRGRPVDQRADLYSVGVMLYELLYGEVPRGIFALPKQRGRAAARVDRILRRAMQQVPELRFQSAAEMQTALESARARWPKRSLRRYPALFLGAAGLGGLALFAVWEKPQPQPVTSVNAAGLRAEISEVQALADWLFRVGDFRTYLTLRRPGDDVSRIKVESAKAVPPGDWEVVELWLDRSMAPPDLPSVMEADYVAHLAPLTKLRRFFLRDVPLPDSAHAFLAQNAGLENVALERCDVGDGVLAHLAGLEKIRVLNITTASRFTARDFGRLACRPVLEHLLIYNTGCGDGVVGELAACARLQLLHLERTGLTDAGLASLEARTTLRELHVEYTAVTDGGAGAFQQARPECRLFR